MKSAKEKSRLSIGGGSPTDVSIHEPGTSVTTRISDAVARTGQNRYRLRTAPGGLTARAVAGDDSLGRGGIQNLFEPVRRQRESLAASDEEAFLALMQTGANPEQRCVRPVIKLTTGESVEVLIDAAHK